MPPRHRNPAKSGQKKTKSQLIGTRNSELYRQDALHIVKWPT